jgi:hypothetical protein
MFLRLTRGESFYVYEKKICHQKMSKNSKMFSKYSDVLIMHGLAILCKKKIIRFCEKIH